MKTIDIFRKAINNIIETTPGLLQKTIALKVNNTMAFEGHAITDFNNFIRGRKKYSLEKQERVAHVLGYSYLELLILGQDLIGGKNITKLNDKRLQKKIMLKDGTTCTYVIILKMTEQIFLSNVEHFDILRSLLIERIVETWKELEKIKRAI